MVDFIGLEIAMSMQNYLITGSLQLKDSVDFEATKLLDEVICSVEGTDFKFLVENKTKSGNFGAGFTYTLGLVSPTVKLDLPYSQTHTQSFTTAQSSKTLVESLAALANITVDYQLIDWLINPYSISINDETPLNAIRRIVNAVGGILQTTPDGTLVALSMYPYSPVDWDSVVATEVLSIEDSIVSYSEEVQINSGYNAYLVTDFHTSTHSISIKEIPIDDTTKWLHIFRVPFADSNGTPYVIDLDHSGGALITAIDKTVLPVEEQVPKDITQWEYVEFINWVGKTQDPIYSVVAFEWSKDDLGAFQIAEDGTLTIITPIPTLSESLLKIQYKTKFWEWKVSGVNGSQVQFYVPEV